MDPDRCLEEIRLLISNLSSPNASLYVENIPELIEKVSALDEWLTSGGFPPEDWKLPNKTYFTTRKHWYCAGVLKCKEVPCDCVGSHWVVE